MLGLVSLLAKLSPVITPVLGKILRGENAKGHAAGVTTAILSGTAGGLLEAVVGPIGSGFVEGIGPSAAEFGVALGGFAATYVFGFVTTWLTANTAR